MSELHEHEPEAEIVNMSEGVDPLLAQWARFRPFFVEYLEGDAFWTVEDLEQRVAHRRAFFFPGEQMAVVGEVEVYPTGLRVFRVIRIVGSEPAEAVSMMPGVEAIARMMGCERILVDGRSGAWAEALEPMGYEPHTVTVGKAL